MRLKSLETNWIRNFDRSIPIPDVVFWPLKDASGKYYKPARNEIYDLDGHPHEMHNGVLVINPNYSIAPTIAHEWRHHWQEFNGKKYDIPNRLFKKCDYETAIVEYFTSSKMEMDAVRFEFIHGGLPDLWVELLFDHLKDLRPKKVWL